jgi:hypothetical protein
MQRRAGHDVEVPLSQLPTNDWQRIFARGVAFELRTVNCVTISHPVRRAASTNAAFCTDCGSLLTGGENTQRATGVVGVTAGSLDDPSWFQPQMDIFVSDAQPWDQMDPAIPKFEQYPPSAKE